LKISHKLTIILTAGSIILVILGNLLFRFLFVNFLVDQEKKQMVNHIINVSSYFDQKKAKYQGIAKDWGYRNETNEFADSCAPLYLHRNLTRENFKILDISLMVFYNNNGEIINDTYFDPDRNTFAALDRGLVSKIESALLHQDGDDSVRIIKYNDRFYIVAAAKITDSLYKEEDNGSIVVGKVIDGTMTARLERLIGGELSFSSFSGESGNYLKTVANNKANPAANITINKKDTRIAATVLLEQDQSTEPVNVTITKQMNIYLSGIKQLPMLYGIFSILILLLFLAVYRLLNNYISEPIISIASRIDRIDLESNDVLRLPAAGNDEFSVLCGAFNKMLGKIVDERDRLMQSEARSCMAQAIAHVGNWELDPATGMVWASGEAYRIYGIEPFPDRLPLDEVQKLAMPEYRQMLDETLNGLIAGQDKYDVEFKIRRKNDSEIRFLYSKANLVMNEAGEAALVCGVITDITDRKKSEETILYNSHHDSLTDLYNRRFFDEQIEKLNARGAVPVSVIAGDVNGLKLINDAFGHQAGDRILRQVASVIKSACRPDDIIARWGGDEFFILMPDTDSIEAEKVVGAIGRKCSGTSVNSMSISISLGSCTKTSADEDLSIVIKNAEDNMYRNKLFETPSMRGRAIDTILSTLFEKNPREEQHSRRVSELCHKIGREMDLSEFELNKLKVIGLVHDIGKIALKENILDKASALTPREWEEIRRHPEIGYRILNSASEMSELAGYVLMHHERLDGTGYPNGLKGNEIPLMTRILSVADSFDAMISDRPYREAVSKERAVRELLQNAGTQFDAGIVTIFVSLISDSGQSGFSNID